MCIVETDLRKLEAISENLSHDFLFAELRTVLLFIKKSKAIVNPWKNYILCNRI